MWHLLFDRKPWFRPKSFGYGTGLPIAWQGWALILSYLGALAGLGLLTRGAGTTGLAGAIALIVLVTAVFVLVVKIRTDGEWRWRWGGDD